MAIQTATRKPNGHDPSRSSRLAVAADDCPYCGTPLGSRAQELRDRFAQDEAERLTRHDQHMRDQFEREKARLEAATTAAVEKATRDATKAAETRMKAIRDDQAGVIAAAVEAERARSEKAVADAIAASALEYSAERTRLQLALADAMRKLEGKNSNLLAEPLEAALFDTISEALSSDRCTVRRVPRGKNGSDVVIEFHDPSASGDTAAMPIGAIAVEAKNVSNWSSRFIPKLKSDAKALGAEPILVTNQFPRGFNTSRGIGVIDGVVVCAFPFVIPLIELMRKQINETHRQKLAGTARSAKGTALLDFCASAICCDLLNVFVTSNARLLDIEKKEQLAHATVWRRRGDLIRSLQQAHHELVATFDAILAGESPV